MILLLLDSSIRISDGVVMKHGPDQERGKPLLYTQKTGMPVWCPLMPHVLDALKACDDGDPYHFWSGNETVCIGSWFTG